MVKKKIKKDNKNKILLFLSCFILLIMGVILFIIPFSYEASVFYNVEEPYVKEVCEEFELKFIKSDGGYSFCVNEICDRHEQYCVEENFWGNCLKYRERCTHYACTKYKKKCIRTIKNTDEESGFWAVDAYSVINGEERFIGTRSVSLYPSRGKDLQWSFTYDPGDSVYCDFKKVNIPMKIVCEEKIMYEIVQKERQVYKKDNLLSIIMGDVKYVFYE